ncbi:Patatin [Lysobacteraceae bacterium NML03-0222]|nr:Patatin [Xanthomonadaceae bacterium NML03-0222]
MNIFKLRIHLPLILGALVAGCGGEAVKPAAPPPVVPSPPPKITVGLALGGGAAKGFAHIGVIKMLEANGIEIDVVAGTSAGSVVGALYASGMSPYQMQQQAFALDEANIRDVSLFSGGLLKGQKLQDYVNQLLGQKPMERFAKPFAAVATRLDSGERTVFVRGNAGQAVRASSAIPGVFEPAPIGRHRYVDGGITSPVPVDAARQLGADMVIAVDISNKAAGNRPGHMLGIVNQSIVIMGQRLGEEEMKRADVIIRPRVGKIGPADFEQRNVAILEGEQAAQALIPQIKARIRELQAARTAAARPKPAPAPTCESSRFERLLGRDGCRHD